MNRYAAIQLTMKSRKSMKRKHLKSVGGFTCPHRLGDEANPFSGQFFPFMSFKFFMVNNLGFHNFNCGI
jgi:hypothetical protein